MHLRPVASLAALACALGATLPARAQEKPAEGQPPAAWTDTIKVSGHIEGGITFNPDDPSNGINFGHLFTDRANSPLLNQAMVTVARDLDPKNPDFDAGFKLQAFYGSDARFTHFLGELDRAIKERNQLDIVEANVTAHLPVLTGGGIDLKLGQYSTPLGSEVIDASGNFFYSHSYIFNFGIPLKHTGVLTTTHATDWLDIWAGVDTGVNTSIGRPGDNNDALAGILGFGLNLLDGNLTVLALSHFGPELPRSVPGHNTLMRQEHDVVVTWKINDNLTSTTELNYIRDDGGHATAEGVAQYLTYKLNDQWSVGGRAEVFRDDQGFFVAAFPSSLDFVNAEQGRPNLSFSGGRTTYGELTLGVSYKVPLPKPVDSLTIRPEVRFDDALNGTKPFNSGTSSHQVTFGIDAILAF